jgi:predicted PurR-regulated permease PerM
MSSDSQAMPGISPTQRAINILAAATVLALLYFGREVLVPIALALFLNLLIAPWVRFYRHIGLGHGTSVLISVLASVVIMVGLTTMIGSQLVHLGRSMPQYQATMQTKVKALRAETLGRLEVLSGEVGKVINQTDEHRGQTTAAAAGTSGAQVASSESTAAESIAKGASPMAVVTRVISTAWIPLQTAGIVLVVLIFVLLEHESLRDRFIRLAGGTDLRATTAAINDAGERLSRFFISTFSVNASVGVAIWAGLLLIGVPNAPLWGTLAATLRFVPYVGVWLVAALTALFAAAVAPDWSLMVMTLVLFGVVEIIVSQLVEPFLYGHTTGLSPLAVVVAAIFWSWLWGPVGLIMSTPLTLCLVVAGRHVKALDMLNILLGDAPALTLPQRLYQRALSGDADEVIAESRNFLKRKSFAAYCDYVLLPALQLARIDMRRGVITRDQQVGVRDVAVTVVETLTSEGRSRWSRRRASTSVLDNVGIGRRLRQQREAVAGRWQGPLAVAPGSIVLCVSLGSIVDDLAAELLTRILRDLHIDARHIAVEDFAAFDAEPHPDLTPNAVAVIYIVSTDPTKERGDCEALATRLRESDPEVRIAALLLPEPLAPDEGPVSVGPEIDDVTHSLEEAAQHAIARVPGNGNVAR